MQLRPPHPQAGPAAEEPVGPVPLVQVPDPAQLIASRLHPDRGQPGHGGRHQPLAARLVDRPRPRLGHGDLEPGPGALDGRGQPGRAAAGDQDVDHLAATASARLSHRIRTVSSAALSTVNPAAVTHAEPASGSAAPSTMTAA